MEKQHRIQLYFIDKKALVGYGYGIETWKMQATPTLNYNNYNAGDKIDIYWDNDVVLMTSSFINGFFHELVTNIGIDGILTDIEFHGMEKYVSKQSIIEDLLC